MLIQIKISMLIRIQEKIFNANPCRSGRQKCGRIHVDPDKSVVPSDIKKFDKLLTPKVQSETNDLYLKKITADS
jgi:hypothetical protein